MVRKRSQAAGEEKCRLGRCLLLGGLVGGLTGFLGVGGGFMIVPVLILFAGIETKRTVGSSLAIIAVNALAGLVGQLQKTSLDWGLSLGFMALAALGMLGGVFVAEEVSGKKLKQAFGVFVIALATAIGGMSAAGVAMPSGSENSARAESDSDRRDVYAVLKRSSAEQGAATVLGK